MKTRLNNTNQANFDFDTCFLFCFDFYFYFQFVFVFFVFCIRLELEKKHCLEDKVALEISSTILNLQDSENLQYVKQDLINNARRAAFVKSLDQLCDERHLTPQNAMQALRSAGGDSAANFHEDGKHHVLTFFYKQRPLF